MRENSILEQEIQKLANREDGRIKKLIGELDVSNKRLREVQDALTDQVTTILNLGQQIAALSLKLLIVGNLHTLLCLQFEERMTGVSYIVHSQMYAQIYSALAALPSVDHQVNQMKNSVNVLRRLLIEPELGGPAGPPALMVSLVFLTLLAPQVPRAPLAFLVHKGIYDPFLIPIAIV